MWWGIVGDRRKVARELTVRARHGRRRGPANDDHRFRGPAGRPGRSGAGLSDAARQTQIRRRADAEPPQSPPCPHFPTWRGPPPGPIPHRPTAQKRRRCRRRSSDHRRQRRHCGVRERRIAGTWTRRISRNDDGSCLPSGPRAHRRNRRTFSGSPAPASTLHHGTFLRSGRPSGHRRT